MSDALADLSAQGVSDLARRHQPRAAAQRQPAGAGRRQARRRRHQQPDDLPEGPGEGRRVRRAGARPGGARDRPRRGHPATSWPTTSAGPATCSGRSSTRPTARTAGSRSRSTRGWPTTPNAPPPRPRRCGGWSTGRTCMIKIPATEAGPAVDHRGHRGRHQRQRHAHLRARPLRRRSWTPTSPGWSRRRQPASTCRTIRSVASFFVSRVDTEIDKRLDKLGTDEAQGAARQGRHRQRPARLRALREGLRLRPLEGARAPPARTSSARCGPPPASRTRPTTTRCTSSSWSPRTP